MPIEDAPRGASNWFCLTVDPGGGTRVVVVNSSRYPDGMRVELAEPMAAAQIADDAVADIRLDADGTVTSLLVSPRTVPKAPPVWFAELRENAARPPAVNLVVFPVAPGGPAPNALVAEHALADLDVASGDQIGALRWWPGSGEVDQIYVQPQWRRRSIGTLLLFAGGALSVAREWPRLWGDGQRTELGEQWRNAAAWRHRAGEQTHVAPPMTPGS